MISEEQCSMKFLDFLNEDINVGDWKNMNRAVIAPGRFNPPHLGHKLVIDTLIKLGKELKAEPVVIIVDSGKYDNRNPLTGDVRKEYLSKMFPNTRFIIAHNPYDAVEKLGQEHNLAPVGGVTGSDRAENYRKMVGRIYGEDLQNSYKAEVLSRDPDSDIDVAGISASKVRQAAAENDVTRVRAMTGLGHDDAMEMVNMMRDAA